jgi:hypothetical protein
MTRRISVVGQISQLRANELDDAFGSPADQINAEVIVLLRGRDGGLGLQLRDGDPRLPARQAMFELLQDAASTQTTVAIDYDVETGATNGYIVRVTLTATPG